MNPKEAARDAALMELVDDGKGYPIVGLFTEGRQVSRRVHILILLAFVGPRPEGAVIRHLDSDPTHCYLSNLAYGTHSDNGHDAVLNGTHPQASKTHCAHGHEFSPENTYQRKDRTGRLCRACTKAAGRRYVLRKAA